jgi:hypothetical protein
MPMGDLGYYEPMSGTTFANARKRGGLAKERLDLQSPQIPAVPGNWMQEHHFSSSSPGAKKVSKVYDRY